MRIHFDNVVFGSRSGPNTFATRLAKHFMVMGHEVTDDGLQSDVSLVFIEPSGQPLAPKVVQRLDGLWFKPNEFETKNELIKSLYERADAIVFQSDVDRRFTMHHWGHPQKKRWHVVHNGTGLKPVTSFTSPELQQIRNTYDKVFVCSSNWHAQKRLKADTDLFLHLKQTLRLNACLIVMGANPDYVIADPHVFYTGSVDESIYLQVYSMADWMIHLAFLDHCPNVVVECLSQGTPVICSSEGGTRELVNGFGIIVPEKQGYMNQLLDYDNPPLIDVTQVNRLPELTSLGHHIDITMDRCAQAYLKVFEHVLSE